MTQTQTHLSANLNKVALLRNQRDLPYPSPVEAARRALRAGAAGVTVHPRPDERHIRRHDVFDIAEMLARDHAGSGVEFNIEGNPTPEFISLVEQIKPDQVTLVPDSPDARTSDHGWDVAAHRAPLSDVIARLKETGARIAIFADCDEAVMGPAAEVGADRVELYTGPYCMAFGTPNHTKELGLARAAAEAARDAGLGVNAGHDLTLENLPTLLAEVPWIAEVSIGHALTADALWMGYDAAIAAYVAVCRSGKNLSLVSGR